MKTKYSVWHLKDSTYQVMEFNPDEDEYSIHCFQGSLSDCEAWIRLKQNKDVIF